MADTELRQAERNLESLFAWIGTPDAPNPNGLRELEAWTAVTMFGFRWMRWHDVEYERRGEGHSTATLCHPSQQWLYEPEYVVDTGEADNRIIPHSRLGERAPDYGGWGPTGVPEFATDWTAAMLVRERAARLERRAWARFRQNVWKLCRRICEHDAVDDSVLDIVLKHQQPWMYAAAAWLLGDEPWKGQ